MTILQALVLGMLQGITEFLPISSSGHLVVAQEMLGLVLDPKILLHFDVVLHAGTLVAIVLYYWKVWIEILCDPFAHPKTAGRRPALCLFFLATIPVGVAGVVGIDFIEHVARTPQFVAGGFVLTGCVLVLASKWKKQTEDQTFTVKRAVLMGLGQAIAILPGFSRSGWTLATGMLTGLKAPKSTEYAFLMAVPAIGGALCYALLDGGMQFFVLGSAILLTGFFAAFFSSLVVMHIFLACVRKWGVWVWSVYLFVMGGVLIVT